MGGAGRNVRHQFRNAPPAHSHQGHRGSHRVREVSSGSGMAGVSICFTREAPKMAWPSPIPTGKKRNEKNIWKTQAEQNLHPL